MHKTERGWCVSVDERRIELKGDDVLLRCARAFSNTEASTTLMFRLTLPVIAVASATSLYFSAACIPSLDGRGVRKSKAQENSHKLCRTSPNTLRGTYETLLPATCYTRVAWWEETRR